MSNVTIGEIVSSKDIMALVIGLMLVVIGGLMMTIVTGVSGIVTTQFQNVTSQLGSSITVTDYTKNVSTIISPVLMLIGIVILVATAVHIIVSILKIPQATGSAVKQ